MRSLEPVSHAAWYGVDGRHIEHWADGGETKLGNLVLLCRLHHRLVHEDGFTVSRTTNGEMVFRTPEGRKVEEAPARRVAIADPVLGLTQANAGFGITQHTCVSEYFDEHPPPTFTHTTASITSCWASIPWRCCVGRFPGVHFVW